MVGNPFYPFLFLRLLAERTLVLAAAGGAGAAAALGRGQRP